ncbi:MAG: AAA family ATPase [Alphaproteobacteria bacterium]|nr:AAA family ATPase [Alphaproteobacteria bacterium]
MATKKKESLFNFPKPIDNDFLVGHQETLNSFLEAWKAKDDYPIHPVWMLCGQKGIGKATLAYKIAKMVYGNIGDFFIVDMDRNIDKSGAIKSDGKEISVYTVRNMIERMQMSSMSGNWRVVLIDSVDELTTAASNAMLKLLEEPPAKTLFLLVTHQLSRILPTIRSRARVEKLHPLTLSELRELCNKFMPDTEISADALKLANGSFGKIASLKTSGGDEIYENLLAALQNKHATSGDLMLIADKIATSPALYDILLDVVAHFNLADLYPQVTKTLDEITELNLKPDVAIFNIIQSIRKCL